MTAVSMWYLPYLIQYQAALAITGAWEGTCHSKLYEELPYSYKYFAGEIIAGQMFADWTCKKS